MSEHFISLNCASCGAKLDVYADMERFSCGYCGTELIVQRRGGTVSLTTVTEAIHRVQVGTDKTAAELALVRLRHDRSELVSKRLGDRGGNFDLGLTIGIVLFGLGMIALGVWAAASDLLFISIFLFLAGVLVLLLGAFFGSQLSRYEKTRAEFGVRLAGIDQEIARQMEIVGGSGSHK